MGSFTNEKSLIAYFAYFAAHRRHTLGALTLHVRFADKGPGRLLDQLEQHPIGDVRSRDMGHST